jgi:hypothetical protein
MVLLFISFAIGGGKVSRRPILMIPQKIRGTMVSQKAPDARRAKTEERGESP